MAEVVNVVPMVQRALVKSPVVDPVSGIATVEVEIGEPYGWKYAQSGSIKLEDGVVKVKLDFERKP